MMLTRLTLGLLRVQLPYSVPVEWQGVTQMDAPKELLKVLERSAQVEDTAMDLWQSSSMWIQDFQMWSPLNGRLGQLWKLLGVLWLTMEGDTHTGSARCLMKEWED